MTASADRLPQVDPASRDLGWRRLAILFLAWLALTAGLNTIPVEDHEAFVLQTAREMVKSGDWVVPYFSHVPRLSKPPLNYWLTIAASRLDPFSTDIRPWHGRIWSMLAGLLLLFLTARVGNRLQGGQAGFLAAVFMLATRGFSGFAPSAQPDFLYAVLSALQIFAWTAAWRAADDAPAQRWNAALGWVLAALATLTKGPQVPLSFLAGFLLFLLCSRERRRTLKVLRPISGVAIVLLLCLPWWLLLQHRLRTLGVDIGQTQLSGSLLQTLSNWKDMLRLFYVSSFLLMALPISLLLPLLIVKNRRVFRRPAPFERLLLFTAGTMLVIFTVAGHYRQHYMLPLLPFFALLLATPVDRMQDFALNRMLCRVFFGAGVAALAAGAVLLVRNRHYTAVLLLAGSSLLLVLLASKELRNAVWRRRPLGAQLLVGCLLAAQLLAAYNFSPLNGPERLRERDFAVSVGEHVKSGDLLAGWGLFVDVLPYYARHRVFPARKLDQLKDLFDRKSADQDCFIVTQQKYRAGLEKIFDTALVVTGVIQGDPENQLVLLKVLARR
jgi:4-amino-4-deoxy-L-arabinose transferase-like glycosyltransferase